MTRSAGMRYGQLAGSRAINETIYRCLQHICEKDARKFVRKFRAQPANGPHIMHTLRELILGAYLSSKGFLLSYEHRIQGSTPDWCILGEGGRVSCIVEVMNFHIDRETETKLEAESQFPQIACVWEDVDKNVGRLSTRIRDKAERYSALADRLAAAYVIALFAESTAALDYDEELLPCLFDNESGVFGVYPQLSGVLFFRDTNQGYKFDYINNAGSVTKMNLPSGIF
jgi:hypothetical protein